MLTILADECKPREPSDYDRTVCAKISDTTLDSILHCRLYRIIKRCIIHGPCGVAKKAAVCMRGGSYFNQFPKKFTDTTSSTTKDGYLFYRRRDNSRTVEVRGIKLDNRWVVPYNPYLLLKYNAHINVEICSTVSAAKYLYKTCIRAMIERLLVSKQVSIVGLIIPNT